MARTTGVRQRCRPDCPPRCRRHRWEFHVELPADETGHRRQVTQGGFATAAEAAEARAQIVAAHRAGTLPAARARRQTVREYLEEWYARKVETGSIRATTARSYRGHMDLYLLPHLGHLRLVDLRAEHVEAMLRAIRTDDGKTRPVGPSTERRILATLRSAVGEAVRRKVLPYDHTRHVSTRRVEGGQRREPWQPETFWRFVAQMEEADPASAAGRLLPAVQTAAYTGMRLGELCGLRWVDVDLDAGAVTVRQQAQQVGSTVTYGPPKTRTGQDRRIALGADAVAVLRALRKRQAEERLAWGEAWTDTGLVFVQPGGAGLVPQSVSRAFTRLVKAWGYPPMSWHGLRHFRASVLAASGVNLATASKMLGHSQIALTADLYGHLFEKVAADAADLAEAFMQRSRTLP